MPSRHYSLPEVLSLNALWFVLGCVLTGLWIYWPLISQSLFPGAIL